MTDKIIRETVEQEEIDRIEALLRSKGINTTCLAYNTPEEIEIAHKFFATRESKEADKYKGSH